MKFLSTIVMVALAGLVTSAPTSENEGTALLGRANRKYSCGGYTNRSFCNVDDTLSKCDANAKATVYRCAGKCTVSCPTNQPCKEPTCRNPTRLWRIGILVVPWAIFSMVYRSWNGQFVYCRVILIGGCSSVKVIIGMASSSCSSSCFSSSSR